MKKDVNFEETLFLLGQEVVQTLIRKGSTLEDAEDAVSKTYTVIFASLTQLTEKNLRPWFYRVSFNHYIDMYRKKKHEKDYIADHMDFKEDGMTDSLNIWLVIDSLKADEQELILLKYYYQLSYEEIVAILGLSYENVKKKLYRTRKKLKEDWTDN